MNAPLTGSRSFKVHVCLGRGGFGEVYRATMFADGTSTEVAVKILHAVMDPESQAVQRLRDERRILAALVHPSILRVHDLTVIEGRIALVTEYIEGEDLDKCTASTEGMSPRAVLEVVIRVADALDAAFHTPAPNGAGILKIVHRDIKPANIRIGRRGGVRLLDFGVARAENVEREAHTSTDNVFGSYPYMAPERFLGLATRPAGDVYGLGCTLYEALCGHRLWRVQLSDIYKLVVNSTRYQIALEERIASLPPRALPARELIRAMLTYAAENRPSTREVCDLADRVAPNLEGLGLEAWCRRRSWPQNPVLPGLLSGRVFVEDAVDPGLADHIGRELNWEANDQEMTIRVRGSEVPTLLFEHSEERSFGRSLPGLVAEEPPETPLPAPPPAQGMALSMVRVAVALVVLLFLLGFFFVITFVFFLGLLRMFA